MMVDNTLDDVRLDAMTDTIAQDVYKYLNKLFQEEARFRSRWVWELLQNARDASPEDGVSVRVLYEPDRVGDGQVAFFDPFDGVW